MKARCFCFSVVVAALMFGGCKSKPTLVGDWNGTLAVQGATVTMDLRFGGDGTLAVTQSVGGQTSTQKGTYKEMEKSFTMTPTSIEAANLPKETLDKVNAEMAKNPKAVTFTLEWKDPDTIAITQQGAPPPLDVAVTLKRKK